MIEVMLKGGLITKDSIKSVLNIFIVLLFNIKSSENLSERNIFEGDT